MSASERASIQSELTPPFTISGTRSQTAPFVFCSPHSGRIYPAAFLASSRLDAHALRKSEDCYVDELFSGVTELGVPMIAARFPRAYLDVNREPYELDPELFDEPTPPYANTQSVRVVGGLGTLARIVADGEEIYRHRIPLSAALERIDRLYKPFHAGLASLLDATWRRFGIAVLIDCHSMPSASTGQPHSPRPDFVLGDRFGASCDGKLTRFLRELLVGLGYEVQLNRPYAGGYITEHYGRPHRGLHALQIEVNRALYLNESSLARSSGFAKVKRDLTATAARLFKEFPDVIGRPAAAE
ncbi:MAG TPA: N-formylglutamate amidohydrolase [Hyphomicrobiaceae bacterium]|jgi:N-formylglutamate amidohydrolase|nr:N-formylglutamate amidohydrolase [Hyphomicrobiaceae bacterium]